jgi:hypothetical protein
MAKWIAKSIAQHAIAMLPYSQSWNYIFQKHVTKSLDLGSVWFQRRLRECRWHLENYFQTSAHPAARVLELGTGWYPTIPIAFWLCGVPKIFTFDIQPVLRREAVRETISSFLAAGSRGELAAILPWLQEDRLAVLRELLRSDDKPAALLHRMGIEAKVQDLRRSTIDAGSIDFAYSNGVLHEIPPSVLEGVFAEFRKVATPRFAMSHYVLMTDLYASFDSSISSLNFLKYSDRVWRFLDSPLQRHNRLRISDYRRLHESAGFALLYEHDECGSISDLDGIPIATRFRAYPREELLVARSWLVACIDPALFHCRAFSPGWTVTSPKA